MARAVQVFKEKSVENRRLQQEEARVLLARGLQLLRSACAVLVRVHLVEIGERRSAIFDRADLAVLVAVEPGQDRCRVRLAQRGRDQRRIIFLQAERAVLVGVHLPEGCLAVPKHDGLARHQGLGLGGLDFSAVHEAVLVRVDGLRDAGEAELERRRINRVDLREEIRPPAELVRQVDGDVRLVGVVQEGDVIAVIE